MVFTVQEKVFIVESYIRNRSYEATGEKCILQQVGFPFEHPVISEHLVSLYFVMV
jgi:hypothetical protein